MAGIQHFNRVEKYEKGLGRLIQEQESLDQLVVLERQKQIAKGEDSSELASKGTTIEKVSD